MTFLSEYKVIFFFILFSFSLAIVLLVAVFFLSFNQKLQYEQSSTYECGFSPFSESQYPFEVQFALVGVLFLLFDIEVLFLFPIASSLHFLYSFDFISIFAFFFILLLGLLYEMTRGVIDVQVKA